MSNGCVCCTIREDLRTTLQDLAAKKRKGELDFERVVIETTGLADPGPVAQTFFVDPMLRAQTRLDRAGCGADVAERGEPRRRVPLHAGGVAADA